MSFRDYTFITVQQQANSATPNRVLNTVEFDFVNHGENVNSWQNLSDTAKLRLPHNIYAVTDKGQPYDIGANPNTSGATIYDGNNPIFMRGDKITIDLGLFMDNMNGTEYLEKQTRFTGYITKIKPRVPIEIECEDEMWILKQIRVPDKVWKDSQYTVQSMLTEMLQGTGITVVDGNSGTIKTNIGDFKTRNETVAQVLERLKKDGSIYSYMRNGELRCSGLVYYPQDRVENVFRFQENITSDNLEYTRKEDISLAIRAYSEFQSVLSEKNLDGTAKTKRTRLEVTIDKTGQLDDAAAKAFVGDMITLPILGCKTKEELLQRALAAFPKFYYTGYRGSFTTFGLPFVKHGDAVIIEDNVFPERNGTYLVKQVTTTFGLSGLRQNILVHLRIDQGYTTSQLNAPI